VNQPPYQYIILHESCRNRIGVAASQAAHAARESVRDLPHDPETHVAILMAESSDQLVAISLELKVAGLHHVLICEPDPPYNGSAVAIGIEPMERERVKPLLSSLKSFRERPRGAEGKPRAPRHAPVAQAAPPFKAEDVGESPTGRSIPSMCCGPWPA
jgi:hypothetical protein